MTPQAAAMARDRLSQLVDQQAVVLPRPQLLPKDARLPPAVQLPLTPALQKVLALDLQRRTQRQEPILVAAILREVLKPLAAANLLAAPSSPGDASAGLLLPSELAPELAATLRVLCERAAAQWPTLLINTTVRLVAGVPFAVMLSQPERVIYVNPVVLTLLGPSPSAASATPQPGSPVPGDPERELAYRSLADCAQKVQTGCRACERGDAAQCAAVRGTLGVATCAETAGDLSKLANLCAERAMLVGSVAQCVRRLDAACTASGSTPHCRELVDTCIANPAAEAHAPDGGSQESPPSAGLCADCTCTQACAEGCGSCGRQACRPFGESCSESTAKSCTESCNDCNAECDKSCTGSCSQLQRDCNSNCRSAGGACTSCSKSCSSCNRDCNTSCSQCGSDCNQCNNDCSNCNRDCNQCNSDCNQCNSNCNQCNSDCNQCNSGCNDCNSGGCNDCNGSGCNDPGCNNQCSTVPGGSGYPRFPAPPGPADPPPPLARMLVGARGAVSLLLPPILFLWWRRRLHPSRRKEAEAAR